MKTNPCSIGRSWLSGGLEHRQPVFDLLFVVGTSILARAVFLWFMPSEALSTDVHSWFTAANMLLAGQNPYILTGQLNWPPFWMIVLYFLGKCSLIFEVRFYHLLQALLISVECGLLIVLYFTLKKFFDHRRIRTLLLLGIALNPVCIFQVCQHGNFDVIVGLWVLLGVRMMLRFQSDLDRSYWLYACFFLGLAILTKQVALALIPLLFVSARRLGFTTGFLGAVLLLGPVALGVGILYVLAPQHVLTKIIAYRSFAGDFGITGWLQFLGLKAWIPVYSQIFTLGYLLMLVAISFKVAVANFTHSRVIVLLATWLLILVPTFGPGYASQYIYWYAPLLLLLYNFSTSRTRAALILFYLVAAVTYAIEYGFFLSHGAYMVRFVAEPYMLQLCWWFSTPETQTLVRLPLFLGYILLVVLVTRSLSQAFRPDSNC